ncbi:cellulose biosynthesis protein BcsE [Martelella alba]|uniref:Cellulose biosynthesis protein BcsE n=1 Tax=Martelella alba TaxID=2590451 RepID=A0ABY2SPK2_9HYPH|nr:cellulose biosynthesis protein BcsE [Martelella alba]TKI07811.1 cellulose biosynthesis protein BcsE [Martelella alba]
MTLTFPFGVAHTHEELSALQAGGCYWVNIARWEDARRLCRQTLVAQSVASRAALVCGKGISDGPLEGLPLSWDKAAGPPARIRLFTLPEKKSALRHILPDIMRSFNAKKYLIIFLLPASAWKDFSTDEMADWLAATRQWLIKRKTVFLILNYGSGISFLKNTLATHFALLGGLSSLTFLQDCARYQVAWWYTDRGLTANQAITWDIDGNDRFCQSVLLPTYSPSISDELLYLAEKSVLEGAPPLSANWRLLEDNHHVADQGALRHAATLIFALGKNAQVAVLARQIHALRRQRGIMLKIVVREMEAGLRYTDERLLLMCGANLVVPHPASLSRFLTLLESVQGQRLTRLVPADIDQLLAAMAPSRIKGPVKIDDFRRWVPVLIANSLMPEDDKGILVALRPVPGWSPRQAISLCRLRRDGDLATATSLCLYLFLSNCRVSDLDGVLSHIFRLPVGEAFVNQRSWTHDVQILAEVKRIGNGDGPAVAESRPLPSPPAAVPGVVERRPLPLSLTLPSDEKGES